MIIEEMITVPEEVNTFVVYPEDVSKFIIRVEEGKVRKREM